MSIWLFLGVGCLIAYKLSIVKVTVIEASGGNIIVLQDKQHDKIIEEVNKRRKEVLLEQHSKIDFSNLPENEIKKYSYMLRDGLITKEEYLSNVSKIEKHKAEFGIPSTYMKQ